MPRILLSLAAVVTLSACATIHGAGQDIQKAGAAISTEAAAAEQNM
ncbi:MAG: entericidin A/B family lipoprotein [Albidovulum sp.]|jgi:entericidin B